MYKHLIPDLDLWDFLWGRGELFLEISKIIKETQQWTLVICLRTMTQMNLLVSKSPVGTECRVSCCSELLCSALQSPDDRKLPSAQRSLKVLLLVAQPCSSPGPLACDLRAPAEIHPEGHKEECQGLHYYHSPWLLVPRLLQLRSP